MGLVGPPVSVVVVGWALGAVAVTKLDPLTEVFATSLA